MNTNLNIFSVSTLEEIDEDILTTINITNAAKVILYNDEWHSFDDVIAQLRKATGCNREKAEQLTIEVHEKGKAMVFDGDISECLKVSSILEEIALHTQIEY